MLVMLIDYINIKHTFHVFCHFAQQLTNNFIETPKSLSFFTALFSDGECYFFYYSFTPNALLSGVLYDFCIVEKWSEAQCHNTNGV